MEERKEKQSVPITQSPQQHPKHARTHFFLKSGLFHNLSNFSELEARIAALHSDQERGSAFEVFAEAYFATQRITQAKQVWPEQAIPTQILRQLGMPSLDKGIDGIFETLENELVGYQVKFRTGRPSLSWTELSTFFGLADRVSSRVLFTNCDLLSKTVADRVGFYPIRGNDLDRLEPRDFEDILSWMSHVPITPKRRVPLDHQREAIDKIIDEFKNEERATAVMACGTGKTLVGLWVAENLDCKRVLVLVPSLALIRQTLHEWLKETEWKKVSYLCVCSDRSVSTGLDELKLHQSDLDFKVSTNAEHVTDFLQHEFDGVKVIFCTYLSSHVIGDATSEPFDLAIFDEAHRTAGRVGSNYTFALNNSLIPVVKRLFMTATPRHWAVRTEGTAKPIYSMDAPEVYGKIVYRLALVEAAERGIICNYKILISVITSLEVNNKMLSQGSVLIDGDEVRAKQVANQLALNNAIKHHPIQRIFTFHGSVASAKSFTDDGPQGIGSHLPNYSRFHVNGNMSAVVRDKYIREFRCASEAIMSNARCLTEGVDVPSVDMVALLSSRKSRVDIVQAAGRAMRKSDSANKTHGFILVPLFVELEAGESIEEAVSRTGFDDVWAVLHALQEHDDVLNQIIQSMQEQRGEKSGFDDSRFRERVEILAPIELKQLRQYITTACVEALADHWNLRFGELKAFKSRFGHCNVHINWLENPQLGRWVFTQRQHKRKGLLGASRTSKLEELGLLWDPLEAAWEEMYHSLKIFHAEFNNCLVPKNYSGELHSWVIRQRATAKTMLAERRHKLDALGFVWDRFELFWEEKFSQLVEFQKESSHCIIPQTEEYKDLYIWMSLQRNQYNSGKLREDRMIRLEEIGVVWDVRLSRWEERFVQLTLYKERFGDCDVPHDWQENLQLGRWLSIQRREKKSGKLADDRICKLESIGISWELLDEAWEQRFQELLAFKNEIGHCNVPSGWKDNPQLAMWVRNQRNKKKNLTEERRKRLVAIGFIFDPNEAAWDEQLQALLSFKATNGHLNVPDGDSEFKGLVGWIRNQRMFRKTGKLHPGREHKLTSNGFIWDPSEFEFESNFNLLVEFKQVNGHCNVPFRWEENPPFAGWFEHQRAAYQKGTLSKDRLSRLEELGLLLDPRSAQWEQRFAELEEFKRIHNHCRVPFKYPPNRKLAQWVAQQRTARKEGYISPDRIERLDALGFVWKIK